MYAFSPSAYATNAMFAVLFGSYSNAITVPGISSLSSLEVDDSVFSSAAASAVSNCDFTLIVSSSVFI